MKDTNGVLTIDSRPAAGLSVAELRELIRQEVQEALQVAVERRGEAEDRLLSTEEAARRLGYSEDWLYRNKDRLPFCRRVGHKLGFSSRGLEEYLKTRKLHGGC